MAKPADSKSGGILWAVASRPTIKEPVTQFIRTVGAAVIVLQLVLDFFEASP